MTTEYLLKGLASSVKMQGSSTREMMMMDGEDGCLKGWVGSWAVDHCQAWRGWCNREGELVVWQGTAVTLSLRRTYCDA